VKYILQTDLSSNRRTLQPIVHGNSPPKRLK
jgi:hypothetical protein